MHWKSLCSLRSLLAASFSRPEREDKREDSETACEASRQQQAERSYEQHQSVFFRELPLEIRKVIYLYLWARHSQCFHWYMNQGRLALARCVMSELDEDDDLIQKQMDMVHASPFPDTIKAIQMTMWQRRLTSSWGRRHWRCEERLATKSRRCRRTTHFMAAILVCKKMYPEVMESIFESHTFLFSSLSTAYTFFVAQPSPFLHHLRNIDITLVLPFADYHDFLNTRARGKRGGLAALMSVLSNMTLRHLRISFDISDRKFWRKVPETLILGDCCTFNVLRSFVVELPASLPDTDRADRQPEEGEGHFPFHLRRRSLLRYHEVCLDRVERLTWNFSEKAGAGWVSSDSISYMPNPWSDQQLMA